MILDGRRILVTGALTRGSIAFHIAEQAQREGAEVILTGFGRGLRLTQRVAARLPQPAEVLELDVTVPEHYERLVRELGERWESVDGVVHAIAYAPPEALGGGFLTASADSAATAFRISAVSLRDLAAALRPQLSDGAAVVGLDFDATVAWPIYDWMGVAKAALEATGRYLARDLGAEGVRVNLVSSGPLETVAATSIPGFDGLAQRWQEQAPLGWDSRDPGPVAGAVCFLLSDLARGITGQILRVDGGYSALGAPGVAAPRAPALEGSATPAAPPP